MTDAGIVPVTWLTITGELQRDWARTNTVNQLQDVLSLHGGATGIAFAWEQQLLTQPRHGRA
jgi:hypothetical protein